MKNVRQYAIVYAAIALFFINIVIWYAVAEAGERTLRVSFLDVGQGDAIFIEAPGGAQMLIDGGPNRSVLRELSKVMPFYDRSIDIVLATHPDKDHIAGLVPVLGRYRVDFVIDPRTEKDSPDAAAFELARDKEPAVRIAGRRGMMIHFGGGAVFEILFPDRPLTQLSDANTGSIVGILRYGNTAFMLTGDAPDEIEKYLVAKGDVLHSDVLKAGHHGSRTSTAEAFLTAVAPRYAVISAGENNSYGHPHPDVVARIEESGARMLGTYENGAVTFLSDGTIVQLQ